MAARGRLRSGLVAVALVGLAIACEGEAERAFYNDFDAADGTAPADATQGGGDSTEDAASTTDSGASNGNDSSLGPDDAAEPDARSEAAADAGAGSDAADASPKAEAGCGPVDTVDNCGQCGRTCDQTHSQGAACNGSGCTYSGCASGYGDCDASAPNTSGCETPTTTTSNCTGCGIACDTSHSVGAACNSTSCTYTGCASGFKDCVPAAPNSNGCETPITTTSNCGACGVACGTAHSTGASCTGASCAYTCSANWINCNTAAPNTGGCECNTPTCCMDAGLGVCQTTHATGFPNLPYYDCNPIATASEMQAKLIVQALEACTAYTGNPSECASGLTCPGGVGPYVCNGMGVAANCSTCWSYGGSDVLKTEDCACPPDITVIGSWN